MPDDGWRSALVAKHPDLLKAAWPEVEDGWHDVVERTVGRIAMATQRLRAGSVSIVQIKQKFGGLRVYWDSGPLPDDVAAQIENAIELGEARSFVTCEICGEAGRLNDDHGWLTTRCNLHERGRPVFGESERIIERYAIDNAGKRRLTSRRRYDRARDAFVELPNGKEK